MFRRRSTAIRHIQGQLSFFKQRDVFFVKEKNKETSGLLQDFPCKKIFDKTEDRKLSVQTKLV